MKPFTYLISLSLCIISLNAISQSSNAGKYFLTIDTTMQNKVDSLMNIANSYYMLGQITISIEYYNKALIINPNFAKAFFNRGNSYFDLGINNKACEDWQKAKQLGHKEADMSFWKFCE
jgi:tetratricopeptide (TPR) repeat protein